MTDKEQIIIDGVNIIGTIDEWARLVAHEWGTDEYSDAEIVKIYISDINGQLARKTQECDELISEKDFYLQKIEVLDQECEELKKQFETSEEWRIKAEGLNEKFELKNTRYRKALEEIEGIAKNFGSYAAWQEQRINKILDIINKAKGEE